MVQGIFDDLNRETMDRWAYPDTGRWDADRNTREFVEAMPEWRRHGLLCVVLNLQGGSPEGYSDFRQQDEPFTEGFQSVPVNWPISSPRKQAFFRLLADITGNPVE